jgi:hypothetical protein
MLLQRLNFVAVVSERLAGQYFIEIFICSYSQFTSIIGVNPPNRLS